MPFAAPKPCGHIGCRAMAVPTTGRCAKHQGEIKQRDRDRGSAAKRGYGHKWRQARDEFLSAHPLCVDCQRRDVLTASSEVDHIVPHKGDLSLFWRRSNWQALCKPCHSRKTASEDGGFGNARGRG